MIVRLTTASILLATSLLVLTGCGKKPLAEEQALRFAAATMQDVLPGMIKTLQEKVTKEGAAAAVPFCREFAPSYGKEKTGEWAAKARAELGASSFRFRRVSVKNRNPNNAPETRQAEILQQWESGQIKPAFYQAEGKFYTMHPIRVAQPLCLSCHGDAATLDKKAAAEIAKLYPQDKATGYKLGDLRGAFITEVAFGD
ncbi:MAG: Tll0287-like domain-containing protein [Spirochaetota bacterium]